MWKKTGLYGFVQYFSVDYGSIAVAGIFDIHKYLMNKDDVKCSTYLNINFLHYWFLLDFQQLTIFK